MAGSAVTGYRSQVTGYRTAKFSFVGLIDVTRYHWPVEEVFKQWTFYLASGVEASARPPLPDFWRQARNSKLEPSAPLSPWEKSASTQNDRG